MLTQVLTHVENYREQYIKLHYFLIINKNIYV